jgi:predicted signal transduction protein with EAL and GGDEF domain
MVVGGAVTATPTPRAGILPKTRSWLALGAPVELVRPVAVLRALFALEAIVWLAVTLPASSGTSWLSLAGAVGPTLTWLALLGARHVDHRLTLGLLAVAGLDAAALLIGRAPGLPTVGFLGLVLTVGVIASLYLPWQVAQTIAIASAAVLGWSVAPDLSNSPVRGPIVSLLWLAGTESAIATIQLLTRAVRLQGRTDADTGLPNAFGLAELVRSRRQWTSYVVASVTLEGIADVREALGHRIGVDLIRRVVEDISQVLDADVLVGRIVGDELVVIRPLSGTAAADCAVDLISAIPSSVAAEARAIASGLVRAVNAGSYLADGVEVALRAHIGLAIAPFDGTDIEELLRQASLASPRAASNGIALAREHRRNGAMTGEDLALLADLRLTLERGELALAYQPQIAAQSGDVVAVEALLRWTDRRRGPVPPDRFIVLAERTGLIDRLTEWVVHEALDAQVRWRAQGIEIPVSVNVSAKSLTRPDLSSWIFAELSERMLPPAALAVEITETAAPEDLALAIESLRPLHEEGVRISLDDFGVGYTSLSVLPRLALSEVKIDRGFVLRAPISPVDEAIVRTIGDLARRLGLDAVAEGVENPQVLALVTDAGIELMQGYHFARPMREPDLLTYLGFGAAEAVRRPLVS